MVGGIMDRVWFLYEGGGIYIVNKGVLKIGDKVQ